jgi:hypothetical protein
VTPPFLAEAYVPRTGAGGVHDVAARAAAAADELPGVDLLTAFFLPEDETCFLLYDAASADLVGEAGRRARIPWQRVQEAIIPRMCTSRVSRTPATTNRPSGGSRG